MPDADGSIHAATFSRCLIAFRLRDAMLDDGGIADIRIFGASISALLILLYFADILPTATFAAHFAA